MASYQDVPSGLLSGQGDLPLLAAEVENPILLKREFHMKSH
jgi:hypothetical protein